MEKNEVLKTNWIWHMDLLMRILDEGDGTELFLDIADGWAPVLK